MGKIVNKMITFMKNPSESDKNFWNTAFHMKDGIGYGGSGAEEAITVFTGWITRFFGVRQIDSHEIPLC